MWQLIKYSLLVLT